MIKLASFNYKTVITVCKPKYSECDGNCAYLGRPKYSECDGNCAYLGRFKYSECEGELCLFRIILY